MRGGGRQATIFALAMLSLLKDPAHADDPFVGRWSIDPYGCKAHGDTAATAPMIVTEKSVKWFVANCQIKKSYRIGDTLALQTQCTGEGTVRVMPISLKLVGKDRIAVIWDKAPAGEMRRCK